MMCPKVAPFREPGMGWGLKVVEDLPKGSLVGEYVGEVTTFNYIAIDTSV